MRLQLVTPRTGVQWVRSGLRTFARRPIALVSLFFMFMAVITLLAQLPVIGMLLAPLAVPSMTLAMMTGAARLSGEDSPAPQLVLTGAIAAIRQSLRPLLMLGLLYALAFLVATGFTVVIDGGGFARARLMGEPVTREMAESGAFQLAWWFTMLLNLVLSLAFWHAPALVHWHGVTPAKSIFFSVVACLRNLGAIMMFGLAWLGVCLGVGLVLSLIAGLFASLGLLGEGGGAAVGGTLMVGGALVVAAMFLTSTYFSFKDSFSADDAAADA